jgi:hypothetical protein
MKQNRILITVAVLATIIGLLSFATAKAQGPTPDQVKEWCLAHPNAVEATWSQNGVETKYPCAPYRVAQEATSTPGFVEPTAVPTVQTTAKPGCFKVAGTLAQEVPCTDDNQLKSLAPDTNPQVETFVPDSDAYALTSEPVDTNGWTRIREGAKKGQYFSWNFFERVYCDRPVEDGEISWDHPILLQVKPLGKNKLPLTCTLQTQRDLNSSDTWKDQKMEMDPYDSSLRGPNGVKQGDVLAWFVGGKALISMDNGQSIDLQTKVCTTCVVPTSYQGASGLVQSSDWTAPASNTKAAHNVAVIRPFARDFAGVYTWTFRVRAGDTLFLWQGILGQNMIPTPVATATAVANK